MSRLTHMIGAGILAAGIALSGCGTTRHERDVGPTITVEPPTHQDSMAKKKQYGESLVRVLETEFDMANYMFGAWGRSDDSEKQLVVRSYKLNEDELLPVNGMNLDLICRAYVTASVQNENGKNYFIAESSDGIVIKYAFENLDTAKQVSEIVNTYVAEFNSKECKKWNEFIQQNFIPASPQTQTRQK